MSVHNIHQGPTSTPEMFENHYVDENGKVQRGWFERQSNVDTIQKAYDAQFTAKPEPSVPLWKLPINFVHDILRTVGSFVKDLFNKIFGPCFGCGK